MPDYLSETDEALPMPELSKEIQDEQFSKFKSRVQGSHRGASRAATPYDSRLLSNTLTPAQMIDAYPILPFNPSILGNHNVPPDPQLAYAAAIPSDVMSKMSDQWHPLHTAQYIFTKAHLENLILSNLGDRGEMAHSIEGRTPFLDHRLTEYANGLPPSMKIRPVIRSLPTGTNISKDRVGGSDSSRDVEVEYIEKYVLREAARPFVTDEIYRKRKHPYSAPLQYGVNGPLHRLMRRLVTEENIAQLGFLEWTTRSIVKGSERSLGQMVDLAFEEKDASVFRLVICVAQWVVLGKGFGVAKAGS